MRLHVQDVGTGPIIVLLHGFPFDHAMWENQLHAWPGFRVIAPDFRGYGQSELPQNTVYLVDDLADDVLDTLDALGVSQPVILGGLSMGGYVALSIAERHPERLRALMLMDTRAGADSPEAASNRIIAAEQVSTSGETGPFLAAMLPKLVGPETRDNRPDVMSQIDAMMQRAPAQAIAATLLGLATRPDRTAILPQIAMPTLVLVGEDDAITPPAEAYSMAEVIPDVTLAVIPQAGHLAPLENPQLTNTAIELFLQSLPT
jgi:pimeloyl-ACP methyl ester carboxylesterase